MESTHARLALLSAEDCSAVVDEVHRARPLWIQRHAELPFFTLGIASYLDASGGRGAAYRERAAKLNPRLRERFGWLHDRFLETLESHLDEPVSFGEGLALPGFHIFLSDPAFTKPLASMHFDLQYEEIAWDGLGPVDFRRQLSLTLTIRLPRAGGGLRLWEIDHFEVQALPEAERKAFMERHRKGTLVPYREGELVIHSGHQLHQIAPAPTLEPDDERVTLQAHALRGEEGWIVYW